MPSDPPALAPSLRVLERVFPDPLIAVFSYGGMPHDVAERHLRLFAAEVMPKLQREERKVVPVITSTAAQVQAK